jgi:hypothetical protein
MLVDLSGQMVPADRCAGGGLGDRLATIDWRTAATEGFSVSPSCILPYD